MTDLIELARRVEEATGADQQEDLIYDVWDAIAEVSPAFRGHAFQHASRFTRLLECGGYLDAALLLVPANLRVVVLCDLANGEPRPWAAKLGYRDKPGGHPCSAAATPALALTAAALRARSNHEGQPHDRS